MRVDRARELAARANARIVRTKAYRAFLEAGGTRSQFDRVWPEVYDCENDANLNQARAHTD
jgi:hypothetical protein